MCPRKKRPAYENMSDKNGLDQNRSTRATDAIGIQTDGHKLYNIRLLLNTGHRLITT